MDDSWTPELVLSESGGFCRLSLGGYAAGQGRTLQEAGDDLVTRLLTLAMCVRCGSGLRLSPDVPAPDLRWLGFLYELGDLARGGVDIR